MLFGNCNQKTTDLIYQFKLQDSTKYSQKFKNLSEKSEIPDF